MRISDWSSDVCSSDLGGYANLHQVHSWTHDFMGRSPWAKKYAETADRIGDALEFMGACGINAESVPQLSQTQFYTSHEALLLRYDQALTRQDSLTRDWYETSETGKAQGGERGGQYV